MDLLKDFATTPAGFASIVLMALAAGVVLGIYLKVRTDVWRAEEQARRAWELPGPRGFEDEVDSVRIVEYQRAVTPYDWAGDW